MLLLAFAWLSQPALSSMVIGIPIAVLGLVLRGWAAGHLAKNEKLATGGPFAYVRNPLYAGTLVTALGIVVACRSIALAIVFLVVFLLIYLPVIELEEQHLRHLFPEFAAYAARIGRFVPRRKWSGKSRPFSWSLYRKNQEYKAALGFAIALCWMAWKCWLTATVT